MSEISLSALQLTMYASPAASVGQLVRTSGQTLHQSSCTSPCQACNEHLTNLQAGHTLHWLAAHR